jgi:hypothetical protein
VDLVSHFLTARQVIPAMKHQRDGVIINMGSTSGLYGVGLRTAYAASKAGLVGLTKSLAVELGPWQVRVNLISPGSVSGERIRRIAEAEAQSRGTTADAVEAEYVEGQSIARLVEPDEVADLVHFLASPGARMITGQVISVAAGSAHGIAPHHDGVSPLHFGRRRLALLEAPHMHTTLALVPTGDPCPDIGDQVDVQCPLTRVDVDEVSWLGEPDEGRATPQLPPR